MPSDVDDNAAENPGFFSYPEAAFCLGSSADFVLSADLETVSTVLINRRRNIEESM